ncbi:type VI secretion system lipoprotein TssJ [Roseateles chitinivorans]|uniref:Type VI secretion system lipoprotein TssJ n=1 Tax=Roseateles chitinivorans TaxID=2917965 RepID=A0A2G9C3R3_9BURK|nr:type VI secretion system lipoprotein TssJ [Roseateles chitinivorans]PIM51005.1 type VI secretion system lipoprotein TssJ [Roseateles chitinivorans]
MLTPRSGHHGYMRAARRGVTGTLLALGALGLLGGCSSIDKLNPFSSSPKPTEVRGSIQASAQLNPSVNKRPSPLLVRVYELKSANAFNAADFISLYQKDQAELGAEMVAREEMTLQPGESRPIAKKTLSPETRFIAVFGAYRDLEHARWRAVVPVIAGKKQEVLIQADELSVSASVKQP